MNRDLELHGLVGGKPNIKKILRGSVSTSEIGTKKTTTVNISESVNKDKSIILIQNITGTIMSNWFTGDFISNNSVSFTRASSMDLTLYASSSLDYTIIEFDNVKSLQKGIIRISGDANKEYTLLLPTGINTQKSLLFYNQFTERLDYYYYVFFRAKLRGTPLYSYIDCYTSIGSNIQYWVVEFY